MRFVDGLLTGLLLKFIQLNASANEVVRIYLRYVIVLPSLTREWTFDLILSSLCLCTAGDRAGCTGPQSVVGLSPESWVCARGASFF